MSAPARARREYAVVLACVVAGAALVLGATGQVWATGAVEAPGPVAPAPVELTGSDISATAAAMGWACLASVAALYATRGWARRAVGALLTACAALALYAVWGATRPHVLAGLVAEHSTVAGQEAAAAADLAPAGPLLAGLGAVLLLAAGAAAVVRAPVWPVMSSRYDRDRAPRAASAPTSSDLWKSLDSGVDPTLDPSAGPARDGGAGAAACPDAPAAPGPAGTDTG